VKTPRVSSAACCVAAISLLYWICAGSRAISRPFWYDELLTWHVSRLPTIAGIWSLLHVPVDQQLPLCYLAVRLSQAAFGYGSLATRLPALVGFWVMGLGIYFFLRRRLPTTYALIGMVFPMLTFVWTYSFEARGYGIVLGGAGLALASWQAATENRLRPVALAGIAVGLAAALASHFTAVLLAVPFALGEAVRTLDRRKLDLPVWIAFAAAAPVTLVYPGLLAATRGFNLTGMQPDAGSVSRIYSSVLTGAITPLLLAGLAAWALVRNPRGSPSETPAVPRHEAAALLGFTLVPTLFAAAAKVTRHLVFYPRYGMLCVIGLAGLLAILMFRLAAGSRRAGNAALFVMLAWFCASRGKELRIGTRDQRQQFQEENPLLLQAANDGLPVVVPDALIFLAADYYLPPAVLQRIHYPLSSFEPDARDTNDHLMAAAARYLPIRVRVDRWTDFAAGRKPFLLYTDEWESKWIYELLRTEGWRLTLRRRVEGESLFEVTP
jgi:Dolichyl-phosphate-mannose-protein mannosyltransferase